MTSLFDALSERESIRTKRTFGNKSQQHATVIGVIKLILPWKDKEVEVRIKDVLWVPELPCRFISTGSTRQHVDKFVDSSIRENQIILGKSEPEIELDEQNNFRTLRGSFGTVERKSYTRCLLRNDVDYRCSIGMRCFATSNSGAIRIWRNDF